jgi:acyl-CoA synthetase (AMP-forming)/AMP-acid ligase II
LFSCSVGGVLNGGEQPGLIARRAALPGAWLEWWMDLATILGMVADGMPDRVLIGHRDGGLTGAGLRDRAAVGAGYVSASGARRLLYLAPNGPAFPVALFAAALAGIPFLPVNPRPPSTSCSSRNSPRRRPARCCAGNSSRSSAVTSL